MTRQRDLAALLRWYPSAWRDRYGDELIVLIEDTLGDEHPSRRLRWSIAWSGLAERARAGGWTGDSATPPVRVGAGALIVLWAWTALVLAGAALAKMTEHFDEALPRSSRTAAVAAWRTVASAAGAGAIAVLIGAVVAVPGLWRGWRDGCIRDLRGHLVRAVAATSGAVVATAGIVAWAHTLSAPAREHATGPYAAAFVGWAALVALCLLSWSALAVRAARRVAFTRAELAAEAVLAVFVTVGIAVISVATTLWWQAMATGAPWFLHGVPAGTPGSALDLPLLAIVFVMVGALAAAIYGVARMAGAWSEFTAV